MDRSTTAPTPGPPRAAVEVSAPARVDLAGGTLDLWPLHCFHPGAITVNLALETAVRVRIARRDDLIGAVRLTSPNGAGRVLVPADVPGDLVATVAFHFLPRGGIEVEILAQPPFGSGLGGSSTLSVALARGCLALAGRRVSPPRLVAVLRDLEACVLGVPTGIQDYWPALCGGALAIHHEPGGSRIERLPVDRGWLDRHLMVVFSGASHASAPINWAVYRDRIDGHAEVAAALDGIRRAADECREALLARDLDRLAGAVREEWTARLRLSSDVTGPALERIMAAALQAGALAAKACGAGGAGSVVLIVPPDRRRAVAAATVTASAGRAVVLRSRLRRRGAVVTTPRRTA